MRACLHMRACVYVCARVCAHVLWCTLDDTPLGLPRVQPGDCVILNAANSTVGQLVVQLCCLLRLRCVAVVSKEPDFEKTALWLKALGAVEVLLDQGSFRVGLGTFSPCFVLF